MTKGKRLMIMTALILVILGYALLGCLLFGYKLPVLNLPSLLPEQISPSGVGEAHVVLQDFQWSTSMSGRDRLFFVSGTIENVGGRRASNIVVNVKVYTGEAGRYAEYHIQLGSLDAGEVRSFSQTINAYQTTFYSNMVRADVSWS